MNTLLVITTDNKYVWLPADIWNFLESKSIEESHSLKLNGEILKNWASLPEIKKQSREHYEIHVKQ